MIGEDKAFEILKRALSFSHADQTEAVLMGERSYLTGFANNYIHRNVGSEDYQLNIRVAFGKKIGAASANIADEDAIKKVVEDAETIAKFQKENPDFVSFAKPQEANFDSKIGYAESTANCDAEKRAVIAKSIIDKSKKVGFNASGTVETAVQELAVTNSLGVERYAVRTIASVKGVIMGDTSSGYSKESNIDIEKISVENVAEESVGIAERGKNPQPVEPGKYEVILTPYAVAEFISHMLYLSLNARALKEGSSFLINNFGKKLFSDSITMFDDGLSADTLPMPFDFEGVPKKKVVFFEKGVAKDVVYDTLTAYKDGKESTGHSLPQPSPYSPYPMNFIMQGGEGQIDDMISHVKHGLFVQRFWYTNVMDPRKLVITGMTRDGLFLIEDGKITKPLQNMRFTESILNALNNVEEISKSLKIVYEMAPITVPYLRIKDFTFTGKTEF